MYQVTFSTQSMNELNKLSINFQLEVIDKLGSINSEELKKGSENIGIFHRDSKRFYRLKTDTYRVYFTLEDDTINAQYILQKHSFTDFILRSKLPYKEEQMVEQENSFWKYLESLTK